MKFNDDDQLSGEILEYLFDRKEEDIWYDEAGIKHHNITDYFLKDKSVSIQIRHFFNEGEFILWVKHNPSPGVWVKSSEMHFYQDKLVKKFKEMTVYKFRMLIWSLTDKILKSSDDAK